MHESCLRSSHPFPVVKGFPLFKSCLHCHVPASVLESFKSLRIVLLVSSVADAAENKIDWFQAGTCLQGLSEFQRSISTPRAGATAAAAQRDTAADFLWNPAQQRHHAERHAHTQRGHHQRNSSAYHSLYNFNAVSSAPDLKPAHDDWASSVRQVR